MIRSLLLVFLATFSLLSLSGCNLWGGIDSPSGDDQILSTCRAEFDQGDYDSALKCYQQLSANDSDIELSESAYVGYTQAGATMAAYAGAFGKGSVNIGPAITTFAEGILANGEGQAVRVAIWNSFHQQVNIKDPKLKALVRFLGSLSIAAEILAETSSNGKIITKADLGDGKVVVNGTAFPAAGASTLFALGGDPNTSSGAATLAEINVASGSYNMFNSCLVEMVQDVKVIGGSGTFGANTLAFGSEVTQFFTPSNSPVVTAAYVALLTSAQVDIGE